MSYIDRLTKYLEELEISTDKISKVTDLLETMRNLTLEIREEKSIIERGIKDNLAIKDEIKKEIDILDNVVKQNELLCQNILNTVREELIKSKNDSISAIDSITATITNRINVSESALESSITTRIKKMESAINTELEAQRKEVINIKEAIDTHINQINKSIKNIRIMQYITIGIVAMILIINLYKLII